MSGSAAGIPLTFWENGALKTVDGMACTYNGPKNVDSCWDLYTCGDCDFEFGTFMTYSANLAGLCAAYSEYGLMTVE